MKIGIFDSGLGGLITAQAIMDKLPNYSYLYLGDTAHLPYGSRTQEEIYHLATQGLDYLFTNDCKIVIIACNTVSAEALRRVQQEYVPKHYPERKALGVIVPTAEALVTTLRPQNVGVLATPSTIASDAYIREIRKLAPEVSIMQVAAKHLASLIEANDKASINQLLPGYLEPFIEEQVEAVILGCTHYAIIKDLIRQFLPEKMIVLSQDEIIPDKLTSYLNRHQEITDQLSCDEERSYCVTQLIPEFQAVAQSLTLNPLGLTEVTL